MKAECWKCGNREQFRDVDNFIEEGWMRIGTGQPNGFDGRLRSGEQRDYCKNCRENIDVVKELEAMVV